MDVSNPLKSWETSIIWANRVTDEFFAQGDVEKQLGLPVGMLNDRDKITRSGTQHGFLNFLVAPLVLNATRALPLMHPLAERMVSNMEDWKNFWMADAKPTPEEAKKREADIEKVREQVEETRPSVKTARSGRNK